ncbi:MAG: histidinol-phosphate transaminase [Methanobrevibacter sp.]|uniref:histidinol-phosphate transaminase n=3 Tax=Methanobrevibacter TaxID=2172 RepID=UPI00257D0C07|nr:histidinol-phosphate transaminase [Methanobrevibacter sp.]MBR2665411.1 histidinol-phosphate transaminase [Methanobrevibacter sp.]MBR3197393.1 histidinol-phosphate transaminase [Methanobrevibacter sp.]MBR7050073.1 histidinol-phosphate transaminase [Methanobrevibacter sp.]
MKARQIVEEMDSYVPGRSQDEIASDFNLKKEDIIKLGSNENPWGPSPKAMKAIEDEIRSINRYPESQLHELVSEVARYSDVEPSQVIIGGDGADEIIDVLAKTFIDEGDEFIVPLPSYMYYEYLLKQYGAKPVYARWDLEANELDVDSIFDSISPKTKMIFLCSPNNPTGTLIDKEVLRDIAGKNPEVLIVIDEAYFEYSEVTNKDLINEFDNIFIIRTMSKVLGLAGMRIGYGLACDEIIEYMHRIKPVFSLTRLSFVAALNTFRDTEYINQSIEKGIESRQYLYDEVSKIDGLNVFPSKSNFMLINVKQTGFTASELALELMKKGIIVRDCTSFKGLDEYWIRISICTLEEDKKFIEILKEVLN